MIPTFPALLDSNLEHRPDAVAFVEGGREITCTAFHRLCRKAAAWLAAQGIGPGDRVAVQSNLFCGECEFCIAGEESICLHSRLLGVEVDGGFAEFATVPASNASLIESALTDVELASFPCAYGTAENLLTRANVVQGETVLVTGASGGVGSAGFASSARKRSVPSGRRKRRPPSGRTRSRMPMSVASRAKNSPPGRRTRHISASMASQCSKSSRLPACSARSPWRPTGRPGGRRAPPSRGALR